MIMGDLFDNVNINKIDSLNLVDTRNYQYSFSNIFINSYTKMKISLDEKDKFTKEWSFEAKSKLIESVLIRLKIPRIYLYEDYSDLNNVNYKIIDGYNRLNALHSYYNNKFSLNHSLINDMIKGLYFRDLPIYLKNRFEDAVYDITIVSGKDKNHIVSIYDRLCLCDGN